LPKERIKTMAATPTRVREELLVPLELLPVHQPGTYRGAEQGDAAKPLEHPAGSARKTGKLTTEQQELLASISRHMDRYVKDHSLPLVISRFIERYWRLYALRSCAVAQDANRWRNILKTMNDLAWSVRPKRDEVSRRRLIAMIPGLYEQLHAGLEFLGTTERDHDAFFTALVEEHNRALHPRGPEGTQDNLR